MALLYQESFDSIGARLDLTQSLLFKNATSLYLNNNEFVTTTGGRYGGGAVRIQELTQETAYAKLNASPTNTTVRMAWHMKVNCANAGSTIGGRFLMGLVAIDEHTGVISRAFNIWMASNQLQVSRYDDINTGTSVGNSTTNINDNAWHHYEVELLAHTSAGVIKVWIDGVLEINISGDTSDAASGDVTLFNYVRMFGCSQAGGTIDISWDDPIVWDDAPPGMSGHLTDQHRISLWRPDANGDENDFTPSAGSNYQNISAALTDDDSTYNQGSVVGDRDLYAVGTNTLNPVSIFTVALENWVRKEDLGPLTFKTILKSGGSLYDGATVTPLNGYFKRWQEWSQDPNGPTSWNKGSIEAAQIGVEIVS